MLFPNPQSGGNDDTTKTPVETDSSRDVLVSVLRLALMPEARSTWRQLPTSSDELEVWRDMGRSLALFHVEMRRRVPFVTGTLQQLLEHLRRCNETQIVQSEQRVQGQILWPATLKKQRQTGKPTTFVTRQKRYHFDSLENQLLRLQVIQLLDIVNNEPPILEVGTCYFPADSQLPTSPIAPVRRVRRTLEDLAKLLEVRGVSCPTNITQAHLDRTRSLPVSAYHEVGLVFQFCQGLLGPPSWPNLLEAGRKTLLLPSATSPSWIPWLQLSAAILRG